MVFTETTDSYQILVGRSQTENADTYVAVTEMVKSSGDTLAALWLHLHDVSSPHGFLIYSKSRITPKDLIYKAAIMVKKFSRFSKKCNVPVIWTQLEHVKQTNVPGKVQLLKRPSSLLA